MVQAGSVIPASLITGIRSDLPGQITAHAEFGRCKQTVDDVVVLPHAIVDELAIALGADDEQRRRLSLRDTTGHLDIDLGSVVERGDRAPGRVVALDRIAKPQSRDINTLNNWRGRLGARVLAAQRDQLVLRILPGDGSHIGLFRRTKFKKIRPPVGVDD